MQTKGEIKGVQYLRGVAALGVVVDHAAGMAALKKYFGGNEIFGGFFAFGAQGVDLFFLISGFIICMISFSADSVSPVIKPGDFIKRRLVRIVPLMWICIISYCVLRLIGRDGGGPHWDEYIKALSLFPSGNVQPNQIWTLRHEFIFYVVFAVSFLGAKRRFWIFGAWVLLPIILSLFSWSFRDVDFLHILINPVNVEFAFGAAIGFFWIKRTKAFSLRLKVNPVLICYGCFVLFMFLCFNFKLSDRNMASALVSSCLCAPILFLGIHVTCGNNWLEKLAERLGNASYSIYLFHSHFISAILGIWAKKAHNTPVAIVVALTAFLTVVAGVLIHLYVERPLLNKLRNKYFITTIPKKARATPSNSLLF